MFRTTVVDRAVGYAYCGCRTTVQKTLKLCSVMDEKNHKRCETFSEILRFF